MVAEPTTTFWGPYTPPGLISGGGFRALLLARVVARLKHINELAIAESARGRRARSVYLDNQAAAITRYSVEEQRSGCAVAVVQSIIVCRRTFAAPASVVARFRVHAACGYHVAVVRPWSVLSGVAPGAEARVLRAVCMLLSSGAVWHRSSKRRRTGDGQRAGAGREERPRDLSRCAQ